MEEFVEKVINVHKYVGFFTLCLVAPAAMLTFTRSGFHRRAGQAFFYLMIFLYLTGLLRTFTITWHITYGTGEVGIAHFWRNLTFNFFGFSLMFYGYRAIYLMYSGKHKTAQPMDWGLAGLLVISSLSVIGSSFLEFAKMYPLAIIGGGGLVLAALEIHEIRTCYAKKDVLYLRHMRYMLASFFYTITVFGIVAEITDGKIKWLWPMGIGAVVIFLTTRTAKRVFGENQPRVMQWGIRVSMAIPLVILLVSELRD